MQSELVSFILSGWHIDFGPMIFVGELLCGQRLKQQLRKQKGGCGCAAWLAYLYLFRLNVETGYKISPNEDEFQEPYSFWGCLWVLR